MPYACDVVASDQFDATKCVICCEVSNEALVTVRGKGLQSLIESSQSRDCVSLHKYLSAGLPVQVLLHSSCREMFTCGERPFKKCRCGDAACDDALIKSLASRPLVSDLLQSDFPACSKWKIDSNSATIKLSSKKSTLLKTRVWEEFKMSLQSQYWTLEIIEVNQSLKLTLASGNLCTVVKLVKNFIKENTIHRQLVSVASKGMLILVERRYCNELAKLLLDSKSGSFWIRPASQDESSLGCAFMVNGNARELNNAKLKLRSLLTQVVEQEAIIDRPGMPQLLRGLRGEKIMDSWTSGQDVFIDVVSVNEVPSCKASQVYVELSKVRINANLVLTIVIGDITQCSVNAIVCPDSQNMQHVYGLAHSIVKKGGNEIQADCDMFIASSAPLYAETSFISKSGCLPCKAVIHVVSPIWSNGQNNEVDTLFKTVIDLLQLADARGFTSVSLPAIGTGQFGFPLQNVTETILRGILEFSRLPRANLHEIRIIDKTSSVALQFVFSAQSMFKTHEAVSSDNQPSVGMRNTLKTSEGISISLSKGSLITQQVDVIVNTTGSDLNLSNGVVCGLILAAAGPQIQIECNQLAPRGVKRGNVVLTKGYGLKCSWVCHGVCEMWDNGTGQCEKTFRSFMKAALNEAHKKKAKSIALPAIGTGKLQIPPKLVAEWMFGETEEFSRSEPTTSLRDVRFVINNTDTEFQSEMQNPKRSISKPTTPLQSSKTRALKKSDQDMMEMLIAARQKYLSASGTSNLDTLHLPRVIVQPKQKTSLKVRISAFSETEITNVLKEIEVTCADVVQEKLLENEIIGQLSDLKVGRIQCLDNIPVEIEVLKPLNSIRIRGPSESIAEVLPAVYAIFREVDQEKRTLMEHTLISKEVQWMYQTQESYEEYPAEVNSIIELAYRNKEAVAQWIEDDDKTYSIDFARMDELMPCNYGYAKKVKRTTSDNPLPKHWDAMPVGELVHEVELDPTSTEYKDIKKNAKSSSQKTLKKIISITRIQNPALYQQYMLHKQQIERSSKNSSHTIERMLWHGTSMNTMEIINRHGFNRSYCGKNGTGYGRGVYFAVSFAYSASAVYSVPDDEGNQHIYLSRVLTGEYTTGHSSYIVPPPRASASGGTDIYNSVVDNTSNPQIFVIFRDAQAYPEYRLVFKG